MKKTHLIGIGGVGMSALAQALLDAGRAITGSDRMLDAGTKTPVLETLARQGVEFFPENDGAAVGKDTEAVVISSAIEQSNPGRVAATKLGVPIIHRADALADILSGRKLVAVAGTCGKSTVTAMLGHILAGAGFDPFVVNGAAVAGWDNGGTRVGSVRNGRGEWAVAEVDESDKSLMAFHPEVAVITNASADHFGINETDKLFDGFRAQVSGTVFDGRDGARPQEIELDGWSGSFVFNGLRYTVPAPGMHNVFNAWNAVRLACAIGADPAAVAAALANFPGVERRLQRVGHCGSAAVIDDYAHNPEKLSAMWRTLAGAFPAGVAVVWRPHGYGPLRKMMDALADTFRAEMRPQDTLILLPVYDAGGTADRSVSSADLSNLLNDVPGHVFLAEDLQRAEEMLRNLAPSVGALVMAGARDPGLPALAKRLAEGQV